MKILTLKVHNFGSYKNLRFNYNDQGLACISGPTGSGKSTLFDAVPWILFGVTAKGGPVDDVLSWTNKEATKGIMELELSDGNLVRIFRSRGANSKDNDLYWMWEHTGDNQHRGKDLKDTQRLLDDLLGFNVETFLSGAYFHEFSQTAQFFTANAKIRRQITEQLCDLNLAKTLTTNLSEYKKLVKKEKDSLSSDLQTAKVEVKQLSLRLKEETFKFETWSINQDQKLNALQNKNTSFEKDKKATVLELCENLVSFEAETISEIKSVTDKIKPDDYFTNTTAELNKRKAALKDTKCAECGAPKDNDKRLILTRDEYALKEEISTNSLLKTQLIQLTSRLKSLTAKYERDIQKEKERLNPYIEQVEALKHEINPYEPDKVKSSMNDANKKLAEIDFTISNISDELADVETLLDVVDKFRSYIINNTINQVQYRTNELLDRHFDAELRVELKTEGLDKLEVEIYKDGNLASYTQLSKGQRHLLKLCFGVSVMRTVSQYSGVSFNSIFLDEVAEGLDETMKIKVFGLLQELSLDYSSVFAIDHSEALKSMFTNRYEVKLINGVSSIEKPT